MSPNSCEINPNRSLERAHGNGNCWICQETLPEGTDRGCQDPGAKAEAAVWGRTRAAARCQAWVMALGNPQCARVPRGSGLEGLPAPRLGQEESPQHQGHSCPLGRAATGHLQRW